MAALAEVLVSRGARVTGSDSPERFYTDAILRRLGIPFVEGFAAANLPADAQLVVHSAAYQPTENPELAEAVRRGLPLATYPEALGMLSTHSSSSAICGVHGKSTTTALCGSIVKAWGLPATVIVGAEVPGFGNRSTLVQGDRYLVAETCEYRRHFLNYHPTRIVMTSIEPEHLDYFRDLEDMLDAFVTYGLLLPMGGSLVYCHDDPGAAEAARRIGSRRTDIDVTPYGRTAPGDYRIVEEAHREGAASFRLGGWDARFTLRIPGAHNVLNAAAAVALCAQLWRLERPGVAVDLQAAARALSDFRGSRRRSEVVGEAGGILFLDDYAHHPTAVATTLAGIKGFYPGRRLVVDFMSHTYSRTRALLAQFAACFSAADLVILHRIYASARERPEDGFGGRDLEQAVARNHPNVKYFEDPLGAADAVALELRPGDLFVTMGAGDNWKLGRELLRRFGGGS